LDTGGVSENDSDLVERMVAALNRRDLDEAFADADPNIVFDWSRSIGPQRGVYRGVSQSRRWLEGFLEAWEEFRWATTNITELSAGRLVIATRVTGRGKGSSVEVEARGGQVWTVRDGRILEVAAFQSWDEALRAARVGRVASTSLYFVCESRPGGEDPHELLESALEGGVDIVQLREKSEMSDDELVAAAHPFREAASEHGALFTLNDRPDLVGACGADGVHVGQEDMPVAEARRAAGPDALVGLSTHSAEQIDAACTAKGDERPDHISVGPVWETPTKEGRPATGLELVEHAAARAELPWFAIGGIDLDNVGEVIAAGATRVVVVRAIRDAAKPGAAAAALSDALRGE
jgi:thiamine-phosphate pyrophosphorylase